MTMPKEVLHTKDAPPPIAPYSHGTKAGGFIFVSGQGPTNPKTKETPDDIEGQTRQVLENVKAIVEAGGGTMDDIVQCQVILRNMITGKQMRYTEHFSKETPQLARAGRRETLEATVNWLRSMQ
jgi:2-iminobutanoate/2-iminopropanoate deaminase